MKKAVIAIVTLGLSVSAWAGQQWPVFPTGNVYIDVNTRQAQGILSNARNSSNQDERISCSTFANAGSRLALCTFQNETDWVMCVTDRPEMIAAIDSLSGDDLIWTSWDKDSQCTAMQIYHDSAYAPKAH